MKTSEINYNAYKLIEKEQSWEKTIEKHGKNTALEILGALIEHKITQPHHFDLEKIIQKGTKLLKKQVHNPQQKVALKITAKTNEIATKILDQNPPSVTIPTLYTTKTTDKKDLKKLHAIANKWLINSVSNYALTQAVPVSKEKKQLIQDSINVISALATSEPKINKKKEAVYCAYDIHNKIHAIAALHINHKGDRKVHLLSSNPKHLPVFGIEDQVKGAGSNIMRHIAYDTLHDPKHQEKPGTIKLMALDTAIPFYEKLGMKIYDPQTDKMNFPLRNMQKLVANKPSTHIFKEALPNHKHLK